MTEASAQASPGVINERTGWHDSIAAAAYQRHVAALTSACIGSLIAAAGVKAGHHVLDVACGAGNAAAAARMKSADAVGLDFSAAQLRLATQAHPGMRWVQGDAELLPFACRRFDAVMNCFGLPVIQDSRKASAEAFRVLKPGGRYAYASWCDASKCVGFSMTYEAVRAYGSLDVGLPPAPSVFACGDPNFAFDTLDQAGFEGFVSEEVPLVWRVSSPDAIIDAIFNGTVRAAALLRRQCPESIAKIRQHLRERIASFEMDGAFAVPVPALIVAARKPSG